MSDFRDYLKRGNAAPETGHGAAAEPSFASAVRPEPEPAESPDEVAVPSGRSHNRMVQTLFVYPPDLEDALFFQYCDLLSPGKLARNGTRLKIRFRDNNKEWLVTIDGERLAYLAGRVGEHKQGVIQVTKADDWTGKLVKEAVVENIVVTPPDDERGPSWQDAPV